MSTFHLTIASVGKAVFDGDVDSATFPGSAGEFTMLARHAPIVTTLKQGTITVRIAKEEQTYPIENGILECSNNRAVVLL